MGYMIAGAFLNAGYFDLVYMYISLTAILQRELRTARSGAVSASYGSGKDTPKFPAPVPSAAGNRGGVLAPLPAGGRPFAEGDPSARPRGRTEPALRIGRTDDPGSRPDRTGFSGKLPDGS